MHSRVSRIATSLAAIAVGLALTGCNKTAEEVTIAIVDDGIASLEQFSAYEIITDEANTASDHGTMMASSILGVNDATQLPSNTVRIRSYDIGEAPTTADITAAINNAVADGSDVINVSIGVRRPDPALEQAVANAKQHGALVIAATGNVRSLAPDYPARYSDALSVAAVDEDGLCWSGAPCDQADTTAPGVNVLVSASDASLVEETGSSIAAATMTKTVAEKLIAGEIEKAADYKSA